MVTRLGFTFTCIQRQSTSIGGYGDAPDAVIKFPKAQKKTDRHPTFKLRDKINIRDRRSRNF